MFQHLLEPATAVNMIVFRAFGILKGCVTLRGEFEVRAMWWRHTDTGAQDMLPRFYSSNFSCTAECRGALRVSSKFCSSRTRKAALHVDAERQNARDKRTPDVRVVSGVMTACIQTRTTAVPCAA